MVSGTKPTQDQALKLLRKSGMVRLSEFTKAGITAATISRMAKGGLVNRLGRGLYQLPGAPVETHHALAEAAKLVPKGVVCLVSALAFHELTDAMPPKVWMAIDPKGRKPKAIQTPLQIVRFNAKMLSTGIDEHLVEGVRVRITNPEKTIVDMFRYRQRAGVRFQKSPGLNMALEGLREGLRQRKATPAAIARYAEEAGIWKVIQPYLEAMTANA